MANNTIEADVRSLIGAIETLTGRVADLEGKVKQTNKTGSRSKTVVDQMNQVTKKTTTSVKTLDKETRKYTRTLSNSEKVMNQFRGIMLQTFGAYAIIRGIRNTINVLKEFESNMARVRAITDATDEEFKRLSDIARDMAKKGSIFSPATIAELQIELSKLGFTASEIGVATEPIVALATATGEDLAKAAEIAAATLRSFQLDASEMGRTIDVMAKSFTTSALDMSRWAEGAKYAAPVANALGWSVEDLGSIMAVLANRQIFGSLAGTSLRNIMIELNNESSTLYKTLELTDNSFEGFIEALGRANEEGLGTTEMLEMIPRRALTAFTVLASSTKEVQRMRVALEDASGAVNEMAEIQLQTLASRLAITQNAWESLVVSIDEGSGVISTGIKGAADWVTELITRLNLINDYDLDLWKNIFGESFLPTFEEIRKIQKDVSNETGKVIQDIILQTRQLEGQEKNLERTNRFRKEIVNSINTEANLQETTTNLIARKKELEEKRAKSYTKAFGVEVKLLDEMANIQGIDLITEEEERELNSLDDRIIKVTERAKAYSKEVEDYFANLFSNLRKLDREELERRANELDLILRKAYQRGDTESPLVVAQRRELEQIILILDGKTKATKEANEELTKEQEKLEKSLLQLEYQRRKNQIALNEELTDQQREEELASLKSWYQTELYQLEIKYEEELAIREAYQKLLAQQEGLKNEELSEINNKYFDESIEAWTKYYEQKYANDKKYEKIEIQDLQQQLKQARKVEAESFDERVDKAERIAQLEYDIAIKKNEQAIELANDLRQNLKDILSQTDEDTDPEIISQINLKIEELERTIAALEDAGKNIEKTKVDIKPGGLQDLLNIKNDDWGLLTQVLGELSSAFSGMADAAVEAANRAVDASSRMVDQLQRDLEIEIALAEEGFASNVSLKRKELEEQKAIQQQALKDQEKAIKQQIALQATLDAANLTASVINIALRSTATAGLAGIAAAIVGAAGLFALISRVRTQSKAATQYEKGGWELLKGNRHSSGGISIGDNREAEDGELLAVFNRKATKKHGKNLTSFIDAVNKDKIHIDTKNVLEASKGAEKPSVINVNYDSKETNRLLKQIRDNQDYIQGGYRIIKQGNRIRKVKINAI